MTSKETLREIYKWVLKITRAQRLSRMHDVTCFSVDSVGFISFESYTGLKENPRADWKAIFCESLNFPIFFSKTEVPKKEYFQKVSTYPKKNLSLFIYSYNVLIFRTYC